MYNKYKNIFTHLWENGLQENNYETKSPWWEAGKVYIKMFCKSYESQVSLKIRDTVHKLQCEIGEKEKMMLENEEGINKSDELSKKLELKHPLQEQVKNALIIRSSFCSVKDMDAPSAYFLN